MRHIHLASLPFALSALIACAPQSPVVTQTATAAQGAALYAENCAICHGPDAKGGGVASLGLGAPPPDLTGLAKQHGGSFPEEFVAAAIAGKTQSDNPNAAMPVFDETDNVTEAQIAALVAYLAAQQVP